MTPDEHRKLLQQFEVDRLLKLLEIEAQRSYDGYYVIFRFHTGFKVAFGLPDINPPGCTQNAYAQLAAMEHFPTLKAAIIEALVQGKTFTDYFDGDPARWHDERLFKDPAFYPLITALTGLVPPEGYPHA